MAKIIKKIIDNDINYIKSTRDDKYNNIAKDFFEPCLSECIYFRRDTGWFRSSALKAWVGALHHLIEKDSKEVRLEYLCSPGIDRKTLEAIKKSRSAEEKEKILQKSKDKLILDTILLAAADDIHKVSTSDKTIAQALAHLIVTEKLEIRFAEVKDLENLTIITDEDEDPEIYHPKLGYFKFPDGTEVTFNGSVNESYGGLKKQGEYIDIFCSVLEENKRKIETHKEVLKDAWEGREPGIRVIKTSEKTKEELNKFLDSHPIGKRGAKPRPEPTPEPTPEPMPEPTPEEISTPNWFWNHQKLALNTYLKNEENQYSINENVRTRIELKGTINMATGTGKTSLALEIARQMLVKKMVKKIIVFGDGTTDLSEQWADEITQWRKKNSLTNLMQFKGSKEEGSFKLCDKQAIISLRWDPINIESILYPYLSNSNKKSEVLIIFDEVHGFAIDSMEGHDFSIDNFPYTLGLSATPERGYDKEGDEFREKEVGKTIFQFGLKEAISAGILSPFNYHSIKVELSDDDRKKIQKARAKAEVEKKKNPRMISAINKDMAMEIARAYQMAENKPAVFNEFLTKNRDSIKNCIIFCAQHEQGDEIASILNNFPDNKRPDFKIFYKQTNREEKEEALAQLANDKIDVIIACQNLSQGIDISKLSRIFLLASWSELRQTIQRVGRCIRSEKSRPDKIADIYDMVLVADGKIVAADEKRKNYLKDLSKIRKDG